MANNFLATANRVAAHLGKAPKDFTKEDIIRVVQDFDIRMVNLIVKNTTILYEPEKIVGSRPPNRVRNCVTDLEKTDRLENKQNNNYLPKQMKV